MTETYDRPRCIWKGTEHPRALKDRHEDECADDECRGCLPCPESHCIICGIEHTLGTCPACLGETRDRVGELWDLTVRIRSEMYARGQVPKHGAMAHAPGGELLFLSGPIADQAGYAARFRHTLGRGRSEHLMDEHDADGEPPAAFMAWWTEKWRQRRANADAWDDDTITWAASADPDFPEFARGVRHLVVRVEDALLDGVRTETGAPCLQCSTRLIKRWGETAAEDRWYCPRCRDDITPGEYARNVAGEARRYAEWLNATDMRDEYGISVGTLQSWASRGQVDKKRDPNTGRMVYHVQQALDRHAGVIRLAGRAT